MKPSHNELSATVRCSAFNELFPMEANFYKQSVIFVKENRNFEDTYVQCSAQCVIFNFKLRCINTNKLAEPVTVIY